MTQDVGGNLDEVTAEFTLIPTGKDICHLFIIQVEQVFHHPICFGNQLHITIFDTVMDHLYKVTGSRRAYPLTTRSAVRRFRRNALKNRLHFRPCLFRAAGHNRRSVQSSLFTTGHTAADEKKTFRLGQFDTTVGIFVIGVTSIDKNISG